MAVKYISITFFFALVVMLPIHHHEKGNFGLPVVKNTTTESTAFFYYQIPSYSVTKDKPNNDVNAKPTDLMLWMYLGFTYIFSGLLLYMIIQETSKIIRVRQDYLGSQSTITDRTIRLSGIPEELRSEEMITETIENLQSGKVESVLLCKDWNEIDDLCTKRMTLLRALEKAWTMYLGMPKEKVKKILSQGSRVGPNGGDEESSRLLDGDHNDGSQEVTEAADRPQTRIWYGILNMQSRTVDAIDYYEEKLRKVDDKIKSSRKKVYKPTPIAFVTLDSTAAAVSMIWH